MPLERSYRKLFLLLCVFAVPARLGYADTQTEYKVKAAFLYNFTKFIKWPASAFSSAAEPFTLCALAEQPLTGILEEIVKGKTVEDRPLVTRRIASEADTKGCQVLFISGTEAPRGSRLLPASGGAGVLIVSESAAGKARSITASMITFVLDANRVRFVIDNRAAEKAGLIISSRLLSLALSVD